MHYITDESYKIINSIKRYEKIAIDEYEDIIISRKSMEDNANEIIQNYLHERPIPESLEEGCPFTIIKKWPSALSVFPIMKNDWHWGKYKSWIFFYDRPKHIAQKHAALMVFEDEHEIECTLWSKGKILKEWNCYASHGKEFGKQNVLISDLYDGEVLREWLKYVPKELESDYFISFPLLLTNEWFEKWSIVMQTRLIGFYE